MFIVGGEREIVITTDGVFYSEPTRVYSVCEYVDLYARPAGCVKEFFFHPPTSIENMMSGS